MFLEGKEAMAAERAKAREYREALFKSTMDMIMKSLTDSGSEFITFMGMCEPEYEVRNNKIYIVWHIEPWLRIFANRTIGANGVAAETFLITGYIGVSVAEPAFTLQATHRREQIMGWIARYLEEFTNMKTTE
jgi:hypothetical protein